MPRCSKRRQLLQRLELYAAAAAEAATRQRLLGSSCVKSEEFALLCFDISKRTRSNRCLFRGRHRKRSTKFELCLDSDHEEASTDSEWIYHFRVSRKAFSELVHVLKDNEEFKRKTSDARGKEPKPAAHQLPVLLKHLGSEGNGASSVAIGHFFGVASGVANNCRKAALRALLTLEHRTHFWPDAEERRAISSRAKLDCLWPNCVGLIDGALLPLAFRPILHGENCLSRKRFYAVVMLAVCDDTGRTPHCHVGWPGSVHDNRVWRDSKLFLQQQQMFSKKECPLGDSAFTPSQAMIAPFKAFSGNSVGNDQSVFNALPSKPRVKSEHCVGVLKGGFPFLRCIRLMLGKKSHMRKTINHVRGCATLHNFLIGDEGSLDDDWTHGDEEEDDLEPEPVDALTNEANYNGRDELLCCLSETEETNIAQAKEAKH